MSDGTKFGRQLSLVTVDQAISSASNILFLALAAHVLALSSFGYFNIIFGVYVLFQCVGRGLVSDPLLIQPDEADRRPGQTVGASLLAGIGLGAFLLLIGIPLWAFGSTLGSGLVALGVCMPLLLVQDLARFIGFASRRPGISVAVDSAWLIGAILASGVLIVVHESSLWAYVLAWAGSGAAAGLLVFRRTRDVRPSRAWIQENWHYSSRYIVGYLANQGSALLATLLGGWILGPAALGALVAALLLSRPFGTFQIAASAAAVVHVSLIREDRSAVVANLKRTFTVVLVVALLMSGILLVLPDVLGRAAIGGAWPHAEPLLIPVCAQMLATAAMTPGRAGLLGLKQVSLNTKIDVYNATAAAGFSVIGAYVGGAYGAMWGAAIAVASAAVLYSAALLSVMRNGGAHKATRASARKGRRAARRGTRAMSREVSA